MSKPFLIDGEVPLIFGEDKEAYVVNAVII